MLTAVSAYARRHHLALVALFVAFGGGAYAAATAPKGSVVSKSIKNNAIRSADVKDGDLTGDDVADDSLTADDIAEFSLPAGPAGPPGPQGPAGPSTGPAGGDLTGNYPDPEIAADAVDAANVAPDALTGGEIAESTLGAVPEASRLESNVGAYEARTVLFDAPATGQGFALLTAEGAQLRMSCALDGDITLSVSRTEGANGVLTAWNGAGASAADTDFDANNTTVLPADDGDQVTVTFADLANPEAALLQATLVTHEYADGEAGPPADRSGRRCFVHGTVWVNPL